MHYKQIILTALLLISTTFAHAGSLVSGIVGNDKAKTTHVEPTSVIMQDKNGQDALVVFYRLREQKNENLVGFSIARSVDAQGKLVWDSKDYVIKPEVFHTQGFATQPVMSDGTLYLFGGESKVASKGGAYYKVLYNSFESLQDLINHTQNKTGNTPAQYLDTRVNASATFFSAISLEDNSILLAYQQAKGYNHDFYHATCKPVSGKLSCLVTDYTRNNGFYVGKLNLANVEMNGTHETLLLTARFSNKHLNFLMYDPAHQDFSHRYTLNGRDGNTQLEISDKSSGIVQVDDHLLLYYKEPHSHIIHKTSLSLDDVYKLSGAVWDIPMKVAAVKKKGFQSDNGVSAIHFKDRTYVFYAEKNTRVVSYFSE